MTVASNRPAGAEHPVPRVGFVSLGCPKATVDSERIVTQLRAEGYLIAPRYDESDLVGRLEKPPPRAPLVKSRRPDPCSLHR